MKIGIVSDSHGRKADLLKAVKKMGNIDLVFHLGDFVSDAQYIKEVYSGKVYTIIGNCDRIFGHRPSGDEITAELVVDIQGKRFFATHGHRYRVKEGLTSLYYRGKELDADIVLYGHTHQPRIIREEGMIFVNPGSTGNPRGLFKPSFGIIEIAEGNIISEIIYI